MSHVILRALAGTGKTTSIAQGLHRRINGHCHITPSTQQQAFWDALPHGRTYAVVAFNKAIAEAVKTRLPQGVDSCTLHSLGFAAVRKAFGNRLRVDGRRTETLIQIAIGVRAFNDLRTEHPVALNTLTRVIGLCKLTLTEPTPEALEDLIGEYDLDVDGQWATIRDVVPRVLTLAADPRNDGAIDFDDMVWLPVRLKLSVSKYDVLIVDEAQDLNACQQALTKLSGRQLVYVGDSNQAIYGFAGADTRSLDRLAEELGATVLPLSVTRRCSRAVVREANKLVPELEAHASNGEGLVATLRYPRKGLDTADTYIPKVKSGDMVVCRTNAPLVSQCFKFLALGIKASIQGRDVGAGLVATVRKQKAKTVSGLIKKLTEWLTRETEKELAKRRPNEAKLIGLTDRYDCLLVFCEDAKTVKEVEGRIDRVFTDNKNEPGIRLSSIHKSKGLEADTVFFLQPKEAPCPHPMAKTEAAYGQELNLRYVAITRAISTLYHVTD